jgi:hypothetical protein
VSVCSWCKKVYVPGEGWFEVEDAIERLHLLDNAPPPQVANYVTSATGGLLIGCLADDPAIRIV